MRIQIIILALLRLICCQCGFNPVRRSWSALPESEKKLFIKALKCVFEAPAISTKESGNSFLYDDFVDNHLKAAPQTHSTAFFLPWHRVFVSEFELALRSCSKEFANVTIPYWDVKLDNGNLLNSSVFQKEFFGGDGNAKTRCVDTGVAANRIAVFPESRCLQREFNLDLIQAQMNVEETFAQLKEYDAFRVSLESTIHAAVHFGIGGINGGDMGTTPGSTNDPFFWIHHSNIDRCWAEWQGLSKKNLMSYGGLVDEKASKTSDQVPAGELQRYFVDGWNTKMIRVSDTFNWCNVKYE